MTEQNFDNHAKFVKGYHIVLTLLLVAGFIGSIVYLWQQVSTGQGLLLPVLILILFIIGTLLGLYARQFPLKAQDRAIRAEESLRYYILTGKPVDSRLTMGQLIALRFAPDDELIPLAVRAANENLLPAEIKKAIKNWRADHHRL